MAAEPTNAIKLFYCYAREDRALRDELEKHLGALKRSGRITTWYDREIQPGTEWEREIHIRLDTADIVLLLISPDFMYSDYCWGVEMQRALERRKSGKAAVIPIIVRPVFWKGTPIGELQLLPTEGKAITTWLNRDAAFEDVARGVYDVVEALHLRKAEEERIRQAREERARQAEAERVRQAQEQARIAQAVIKSQHSLKLRLVAADKTDVGKQLVGQLPSPVVM